MIIDVLIGLYLIMYNIVQFVMLVFEMINLWFGFFVKFVGNILFDMGVIQFDDFVVGVLGIEFNLIDLVVFLFKGWVIGMFVIFNVSQYYDGSQSEDVNLIWLLLEFGQGEVFGDKIFGGQDFDVDSVIDIVVFYVCVVMFLGLKDWFVYVFSGIVI